MPEEGFNVTRFADLFFLLGILFYSFYVGTFNYDLSADATLASKLPGAAWVLPTALFMMFIGGAGKSAMFPLHICFPMPWRVPRLSARSSMPPRWWWPGVFQVASLFPIWGICPRDAPLHRLHRCLHRLLCRCRACAQSDIKRGLAFSTISQIAYMLVALGVCTAVEGEGGLGYMASMFHLFTHAMFKALRSSARVPSSSSSAATSRSIWAVCTSNMPIHKHLFSSSAPSPSAVWALGRFLLEG
jgi:NADH-quinone oxidoreductase subunit L